MKRTNIIILVICFSLYLINNFVLKKYESSFQMFFICWFNDLIAPILALAYINFRFGEKILSIIRIIVFCTMFALFWEFGALIIKPNSVFDPLDIICYYIGGLAYYIIISIHKITTGKRKQ